MSRKPTLVEEPLNSESNFLFEFIIAGDRHDTEIVRYSAVAKNRASALKKLEAAMSIDELESNPEGFKEVLRRLKVSCKEIQK